MKPVITTSEVVKAVVDEEVYYYLPSGVPSKVLEVNECPIGFDINLVEIDDLNIKVSEAIRHNRGRRERELRKVRVLLSRTKLLLRRAESQQRNN